MADESNNSPNSTERTIAAASALLQQYGDDAEFATLRAAEFAAAGDVEALAAWDLIIAYLDAMRKNQPTQQGAGPLN